MTRDSAALTFCDFLAHGRDDYLASVRSIPARGHQREQRRVAAQTVGVGGPSITGEVKLHAHADRGSARPAVLLAITRAAAWRAKQCRVMARTVQLCFRTVRGREREVRWRWSGWRPEKGWLRRSRFETCRTGRTRTCRRTRLACIRQTAAMHGLAHRTGFEGASFARHAVLMSTNREPTNRDIAARAVDFHLPRALDHPWCAI